MTTENQVTNERREALLMQYQTLQHDSSSMISAHWTVVGIFIGINTALLGAVAYILADNRLSNNTQWIVLGLGVASVFIFALLCLWLNRINYLVELNKDKMSDIETNPGMSLDGVTDSKETRKQKRESQKCKFFPCIPSVELYQ